MLERLIEALDVSFFRRLWQGCFWRNCFWRNRFRRDYLWHDCRWRNFWIRAVLLLLLLPVGLVGLVVGLEAVQVVRTGLCPPLNALQPYPCSLSDYLVRELWRNDWLGFGVVVLFGLSWLIGLPLLLALTIQSCTSVQTRSWLAWIAMLGGFVVSSFFGAILVFSLVSSLIASFR